MGELPLANGSRVSLASGRISFSGQEPWVFSASIRQNILFGSPMHRKRYRRALKAVCLDKVFVTETYNKTNALNKVKHRWLHKFQFLFAFRVNNSDWIVFSKIRSCLIYLSRNHLITFKLYSELLFEISVRYLLIYISRQCSKIISFMFQNIFLDIIFIF